MKKRWRIVGVIGRGRERFLLHYELEDCIVYTCAKPGSPAVGKNAKVIAVIRGRNVEEVFKIHNAMMETGILGTLRETYRVHTLVLR